MNLPTITRSNRATNYTIQPQTFVSYGGFFRFSRAGWPTCCSLDYVYSIAKKMNFVNTFEEEIFRKMEKFVRWRAPNIDRRFYANLP